MRNRDGYVILGRGRQDKDVLRLFQIETELEELLFKIRILRLEKEELENKNFRLPKIKK